MFGLPQSLLTATTCLSFFAAIVSSHTIITYPGWRGDNLHTNGSISGDNGTYVPDGTYGLGVGDNNTYPYGMQWMYPCGGMPMSSNRTKWPVSGGAVGVQPGWFQGHSLALMYINLGDGTVPQNYSLPMQTVFGIMGPNNNAYNGSLCMPQVPLPANYTAVVGNNATIQVIEAAQHGAALYNCVDITFAEPEDVPEVTPDNCSNSSDISFQYVFQTSSLTSGADSLSSRRTWLASIPLAAAMMFAMTI